MYHTSTHDRHVCLLRYVLQVAAKLQECTRVRTALFNMISGCKAHLFHPFQNGWGDVGFLAF